MLGTKSTACSRRSPQGGHTLIEVLAALAILGTLLAGVVLAKSRLTRRMSEMQRRNAAVKAADGLIAGWWARREGVPVGESGVMGDALFAWKTRVAPNPQIESLGARAVRVEIRDVGAAPESEPLFVVDLVLDDPDREKERIDE